MDEWIDGWKDEFRLLTGPAHYQHSEGQSKMSQKSSMFQSTSKRLHSPPPIVTVSIS